MKADDIWVLLNEEKDGKDVKHILSVMDIKKMIPVKDSVYTKVNFGVLPTDSPNDIKYKDLLRKEYIFCMSIIENVIKKASSLYEKQIDTGIVKRYCCDFKKLEEVCDTY